MCFIRDACVHIVSVRGVVPHHVVVDDFLKALSTFFQKLLQNSTHTFIHGVLETAAHRMESHNTKPFINQVHFINSLIKNDHKC